MPGGRVDRGTYVALEGALGDELLRHDVSWISRRCSEMGRRSAVEGRGSGFATSLREAASGRRWAGLRMAGHCFALSLAVRRCLAGASLFASDF